MVRANSVLMPIERVGVLAEERRRIDRSSGRSVASYSWRNIRLGFSHSTLFSRRSRSSTLRGHRDRVARGQLLRV